MLMDIGMVLILVLSFALVTGFVRWCANVIRH